MTGRRAAEAPISRRRAAAPALLLPVAVAFFAFGLSVREHYGLTWDEAESYEAGRSNLEILGAALAGEVRSVDAIEWPWHEVTGHQLVLDTGRAAAARAVERYVPAAFPVPAFPAPAERVSNLALSAASLALAGAIVVEVTANLPLAALAAAALALQPKLLAHAQNNPKDLPGLFVFTLGVAALIRLARRPGAWRLVAAAAALGLALTTWLPSIALAPLAAILLLAWPGRDRDSGSEAAPASKPAKRAALTPAALGGREAEGSTRRDASGAAPATTLPPNDREGGGLARRVGLLAVVLAGGAAVTLLLWPWLWPAPVARLRQVADRLAEFPTGFEVLYFGRLYPSSALPVHYTAGSVLVSTPLTFVALAALGAVVALWRRDDRARRRLAAIAVAWIASLLALDAVASFHYDGARHVLAALPAIAILTALGAERLHATLVAALRRRAGRHASASREASGVGLRGAAVLAALPIALPAIGLVVDLVRLHPYQDAYVAWPFRRIAPGATERVFELEYWGSSYRELAAWLNARAEPGATVLAPIAPHCLEPYLRSDLVVRERMRRAQALDASPYVVFMTRHAWYRPLGLDEVARSGPPLHAVRVPHGTLAVVHRPDRLPPALTRPGGPRSWRPPRDGASPSGSVSRQR